MPRKHCRSRLRSRGRRVLTADNKQVRHFAFFQLPGAAWQDWNYRTITARKGFDLVRDGEAAAEYRKVDGAVQLVGFRATKPTRWERPSPATLTEYTLGAVGTHAMGGPMTRGEHREVEKFVAWPLIGDTKAPCVRPRIPEDERRRAESMLRCGGMRRRAA